MVSIAPVYRWLLEMKCFYCQKETAEKKKEDVTHLLLDGFKGGKIILPQDLEQTFLTKYANDCQNGNILYIVERRTPVFSYFFDFDIYQNYDLINEEGIYKEVQSVLQVFYPEEEASFFDLVITASPTKQGTKEGLASNCNKYGRHGIAPNINVNSYQALLIREAAIIRLSRKFPRDAVNGNTWASIFDDCVYTNNGLRMIFSDKTETCQSCKYTPSQECNSCHGYPTSAAKRIYTIHMYIGEGGNDEEIVKVLKCNHDSSVKICTIRRFTPLCEGWHQPKTCAMPKISGNSVEVTTQSGVIKEFKEDYLGMKNMKNSLPVSRPQWNLLQKCVNDLPVDQYNHVKIRDVVAGNRNKKNKVPSYFKVIVKNEGSNYCMNVKREHRKNSVWFLVEESGIRQKCFCRCTGPEALVGREWGLCKLFVSSSFPISREVKEVLFPGSQSSLVTPYQDKTLFTENSLSRVPRINSATNKFPEPQQQLYTTILGCLTGQLRILRQEDAQPGPERVYKLNKTVTRDRTSSGRDTNRDNKKNDSALLRGNKESKRRKTNLTNRKQPLNEDIIMAEGDG